jgi:hypothetical protein
MDRRTELVHRIAALHIVKVLADSAGRFGRSFATCLSPGGGEG